MKEAEENLAPRPVTDRESAWIREILQTDDEWRGFDIAGVRVVSRGPCDEGISIELSAPENPNAISWGGYIGRVVILTADNGYLEIRLTYSNRRLDELFMLFVDPKHLNRPLPEHWTEVSHEAEKL